MPVYGSFSTFLYGNTKGMKWMLEKTRDEGLDVLEETIKDLTPVDSGELRESIHQEGKRTTEAYRYEGTIATELDYARAIEYGAAPHIITPKKRRALKFDGMYASEVHHPGFPGAHMFQIGTRTFERTLLEPIMVKNWKELIAQSKVSGKVVR